MMRLGRMAGAGGDDIFVAVRRAEVDVLHLFDRNAALYRDVGGCADGRAGIAGGRLDEEFAHIRAGDDLLVELDVERAAAGKGEAAGLAQDVAEVMLDHLQRQILEQLLHARRVVDVGVVGDVSRALRAQPVDQLRRKVVALAVFLVAAEADHVGVVGVDRQFAVLELRQAREIVAVRVAVRRHAHHLVLAVEHLEAEVLGQARRTARRANRGRRTP
jgi:hypothetical protein